MEYLTIKQAAEKWNLTTRWVQVLCSTGKIEGVVKFGRAWDIPANAEKPKDSRIKTGEYMKKRDEN